MKSAVFLNSGNRTFTLIRAEALLILCSILLIISSGCKTTESDRGDSKARARAESPSDEQRPNEFEAIMQRLNGPLHSAVPRSDPKVGGRSQIAESTKPVSQPAPNTPPTRVASIPVTPSPAPLPVATSVAQETNSVAVEPPIVGAKVEPVQASVLSLPSIQAAISKLRWPRLNWMAWTLGAALLCAAALKLCRPLRNFASSLLSLIARQLSNALTNAGGLVAERFRVAARLTNAKATAEHLLANVKATTGHLFDRLAEKILPASTNQWWKLLRAERKLRVNTGKAVFKRAEVASSH